MKFVIGLTVLALAALSQATKKPDKDFDLKILNKAIVKCTPKYVVQSCKCPPNNIYWDDCMYDYLQLTNGPKKGSCVTLTEIEKFCALYEKNKNECFKICKDGKPIKSIIDKKDCIKDIKPVDKVIKDKDCNKDKILFVKDKTKEVVDDKKLSTHHSEKEAEKIKKLSLDKDDDADGLLGFL